VPSELLLHLHRRPLTLVSFVSSVPVCRLCNEFGEDIIISKCHHAFDRECISTYLQGYGSVKVSSDSSRLASKSRLRSVFASLTRLLRPFRLSQAPCPVCSASISIDLEAEAVDQDEEKLKKAKQGMLGRLDLSVSFTFPL